MAISQSPVLHFIHTKINMDDTMHRPYRVIKKVKKADGAVDPSKHVASGHLEDRNRVTECHGSCGYIRVKKWLNVEKLGNLNGGESLLK